MILRMISMGHKEIMDGHICIILELVVLIVINPQIYMTYILIINGCIAQVALDGFQLLK